MNRIDRLLGMLTQLQSKKYVTAEKLADKFNISVRTVYRDVKALGELGIPVSFEQHKGYFIMQGYFLPPVSFTTEEANALLLTEALVQGFADKSIQTHYANVLTKIKAVLRTSQKEKVEDLTRNIKLQVPSCFQQDYEYLSSIQDAIAVKCMLDMEYKTKNGATTRRQVEPIGLVFYALNWHLIAWCHKRQEYRDFKVSNIQQLKKMDIAFKKKDHMPLDEYMKLLPVNY
jgi:predicted DNA-binding transcriptional regulator YafY